MRGLTFSWQFMQRLSTCITPVSSFLSTNSVAVWNCDSGALFSFLSIDMMDVVKRCIESVKFGGVGGQKKKKKKKREKRKKKRWGGER